MGYVVPAGFARVSFDYQAVSTTGSKPSFGFGIDRPPSETLCEDLAEWWRDELKPDTNAGTVLERVTMRSDVGFYEVPVGEAGGQPGDHQPPQVSPLIRLTTGLAGRANRGRIYLPYVLLDNMVDGQGFLDEARIVRLAAIMTSLVALLELNEAQLVILHSSESAPTPVTSFTVQQQVATQRRRNRR